MAKWSVLYTQFLRSIKKAASDDLQGDFIKFSNMMHQDIQEFAGVDKTWSVSYTANTETITLAAASATDLWKAREGRFLPTGTEDKLKNWERLAVLAQFNDNPVERGFYIYDDTIYIPEPYTAAGTLKIRGEQTLTDVVAADITGATTSPEIVAQFHDLYAYFSAMMYGAQKQDFTGDGRFPNFRGMYAQRESELQRYYNRSKQKTRRTRVVYSWT